MAADARALRTPAAATRLKVTNLVRLVGVALLLALVVAPEFGGRYYTGLISEILIFAIFAMSLDLLVGFTGLVSFGHAAYFGLSTYLVMLLGTQFGINPVAAMPLAIIGTTLFAALVGFFCTRTSGIAFLMVTMAVSQLLYSVAIKWRSVTGGSDGIGSITPPQLGPFDFGDPTVVYYVILIGFVASLLIMRRFLASPAGCVMVGIRENEGRMRAIGVRVHLYKTLAFTVAGAFAALAGALFALQAGFVSADILMWTRSGEGLVMVVLGGTGTLIGPALGAAVFIAAKDLVSSNMQHWLLVLGVVLITCVLFNRDGLYGAFAKRIGLLPK